MIQPKNSLTADINFDPAKYALIDLHIHLDGSLSPHSVSKAAEKENIDLPGSTEEELAHFLSIPEETKNLNDYLKCFDIPLLSLQTKEGIKECTYDLIKRLDAEKLLYAEIRFAPSLCMTKGLTQLEAAKAVLKGAKAAKKNINIKINFILCMMRGNDFDTNKETVDTAKKLLNKGVCAVDLAGAEAVYPTAAYKELFAYAKKLNVPYTIHAGEADDFTSVDAAVSFGAKRIGHGVHSIENENTMDMLVKKNIFLEMCPTSNLQTKAVADIKDYPIPEFLRRGIKVTLNTDNKTVSATSLAKEYDLIFSSLSLTQKDAVRILFNSLEASFLDEKEKAKLRKKIIKRLEE